MVEYLYLLNEGSFFAPKNAKLARKEGGKQPPEKEGQIFIQKYGGAVMRVRVTLACTECNQRNYNTMKNKKNTPDRLEMNKYCKFCKKHTLHRETK